MRIRNVSEPQELGFGENGVWKGRKINRDKEGDIHSGWNPKYWGLAEKSLDEMTNEEIELREGSRYNDSEMKRLLRL